MPKRSQKAVSAADRRDSHSRRVSPIAYCKCCAGHDLRRCSQQFRKKWQAAERAENVGFTGSPGIAAAETWVLRADLGDRSPNRTGDYRVMREEIDLFEFEACPAEVTSQESLLACLPSRFGADLVPPLIQTLRRSIRQRAPLAGRTDVL
mgnify:CR=1 FL=1